MMNQAPQSITVGQWFQENNVQDRPSGWKFRLDGSDWSIMSGLFLRFIGYLELERTLLIIGGVCFYLGIISSYRKKRRAKKQAYNRNNAVWHESLDGSDWAILVGWILDCFAKDIDLRTLGWILLTIGILSSFVNKRKAETEAENSFNPGYPQINSITVPNSQQGPFHNVCPPPANLSGSTQSGIFPKTLPHFPQIANFRPTVAPMDQNDIRY